MEAALATRRGGLRLGRLQGDRLLLDHGRHFRLDRLRRRAEECGGRRCALAEDDGDAVGIRHQAIRGGALDIKDEAGDARGSC